MIKTKKETVTVKKCYYEYFCDCCNVCLGANKGEDDYSESFGNFEYSFYLDGWYKIKKTLCSECRNLMKEKIGRTLENFGFERNN